MTSQCDAVAERLALGEPLDSLADHVASCGGCTRLVEMPRRIGAARQELDPGLGFSARMTAGAQHRIAVRRRRRVTAGLAAAMAAGALGVLVFTRQADAPASTAAIARQPLAEEPRPAAAEEADVDLLVNLADTERSLRLSASWRALEEPLGAYRRLVEEVQAGAEVDAEADPEADAEVDAEADAEVEGDVP
jgi:hypothetical protein